MNCYEVVGRQDDVFKRIGGSRDTCPRAQIGEKVPGCIRECAVKEISVRLGASHRTQNVGPHTHRKLDENTLREPPRQVGSQVPHDIGRLLRVLRTKGLEEERQRERGGGKVTRGCRRGPEVLQAREREAEEGGGRRGTVGGGVVVVIR